MADVQRLSVGIGYYTGRLREVADQLDASEEATRGSAPSDFIRERIRTHHEEFERFTFKVSQSSSTDYHALMEGTMHTYLMACSEFLEKILHQQRMAKKAKSKRG